MKIRVFSTPTCPYCVALKMYLQDNHLSFDDIDVSQDLAAQKEMVEKTEQLGVPVVEIEGEWIVGFDKAKIAARLRISD